MEFGSNLLDTALMKGFEDAEGVQVVVQVHVLSNGTFARNRPLLSAFAEAVTAAVPRDLRAHGIRVGQV